MHLKNIFLESVKYLMKCFFLWTLILLLSQCRFFSFLFFIFQSTLFFNQFSFIQLTKHLLRIPLYQDFRETKVLIGEMKEYNK